MTGGDADGHRIQGFEFLHSTGPNADFRVQTCERLTTAAATTGGRNRRWTDSTMAAGPGFPRGCAN